VECGRADIVSSDESESGFVQLEKEGNKEEREEREVKMRDERTR